MAELPDVFKDDEVEDEGFSLASDGWHVAEIEKDKLKKTQAGGTMLTVYVKIIEGEDKGKRIFDGLNIVNKSDVAMRIAKGRLKSYKKACGVEEDMQDTSVMWNIPIKVKVGTEPASNGYPPKNKILQVIGMDEEVDDEGGLEL